MKSHPSFLFLVVCVFMIGLKSVAAYDVVCNPDNSIGLSDLPENNNYFAMQSVPSGPDTLCNVTIVSSTSVKITDCLKDLPILLTYGSYADMEKNLLHGGRTVLVDQIQCNEIPESGNIHVINNSLASNLDIARAADLDITYSVTSSLNPSSTTVGQPVIWTISLPPEYILEVSSCTAFRGQDDSSPTQITLISSGGCVANDEVIGQFTDNFNGTVTATIYAFRFYDEEYVFLKCELIVCPDSSLNICDTTCSRYLKRSIPTRKSRESGENKLVTVHNILRVAYLGSTGTMIVVSPVIVVFFLFIVLTQT